MTEPIGGDATADDDADGSSDGTAESDGGYVHQPASEAGEGPVTGAGSADEPGGFGRQGWLLVVAVVVCFLVIPGIIYLNPAAPASVGWPFFATFLVLPLLPAVGLGLLAVWSMQAAS